MSNEGKRDAGCCERVNAAVAACKRQKGARGETCGHAAVIAGLKKGV